MPILQREQCFSRPIRTIGAAESSGVRTLDIPLQRQGDAYFREICGRRDCCWDAAETDGIVRKAQAGTGSVPGDPISAELRRTSGEVSSYGR
jgi:hypothetical protein